MHAEKNSCMQAPLVGRWRDRWSFITAHQLPNAEPLSCNINFHLNHMDSLVLLLIFRRFIFYFDFFPLVTFTTNSRVIYHKCYLHTFIMIMLMICHFIKYFLMGRSRENKKNITSYYVTLHYLWFLFYFLLFISFNKRKCKI